MEQRLSLITLGVADLERSRAFYADGLGWTPSTLGNGEVVFFQAAGVVFGLYGRDALAEDAGLPDSVREAEASGFRGVALAHNTRTRRRAYYQARRGGLLGRVFGLLCRPGRTSVGGGVEPGDGDRCRRACAAPAARSLQ